MNALNRFSKTFAYSLGIADLSLFLFAASRMKVFLLLFGIATALVVGSYIMAFHAKKYPA